ncbi:hypothetical protein GDO78_014575 [Eleutherodactylus coqui]|uniref:Uncharacterized protein n=1 Tax=Eleutherodactylus coqui TaxID=57060 RepID=A0A8J6B6G9_ELECQ|nr:hypothetical protein GDO78_014575 [Eleutherodactylus coqui]
MRDGPRRDMRDLCQPRPTCKSISARKHNAFWNGGTGTAHSQSCSKSDMFNLKIKNLKALKNKNDKKELSHL